MNYRYNSISFAESVFLDSDKNFDSLKQYGALVQAQYNVTPDTLDFIVGTKLDHNDLTGWENQPSARLIYKPVDNHLTWGAISRSVRTPTLIEFNDNFKVNGTEIKDLTGLSSGFDQIDDYRIATYLNGNDKVKSENYLSYELGYRFTANDWSLDLSTYYTDAKNVAVIDMNTHAEQFTPILDLSLAGRIPEVFQALTMTRIDLDFASVADTTTKWLDLVVSWQPIDNLNTEFGYSYTDYNYDLPPRVEPAIGYDSKNRQLFAKADYSFLTNHNVFATLRAVNSNAYNTDNYTTLDISWNWQATPVWSTAVSGKNLFSGSHIEYSNTRETYTLPNYIDECITFTISANF